MFSLYSTLVLVLAISTAFAAPVDDNDASPLFDFTLAGKGGSNGKVNNAMGEAKAAGSTDAGFIDGFYYIFYKSSSSPGDSTWTNGPGGLFSADWKGREPLFGGKGWQPGLPDRVINYNGTFDIKKHIIFTLMGEMDNPPTYYFVVEDAVPSTQDFGTEIGSVDCDGASYKVTHYSAVYGGVTYEKYYSVRTQPKFHRGQVKGTISVGCHWDVWTRLGMKVGDQKEQFMLIEGAATKSPRAKDLGGSASITVSEGSSS